MNIVPLHDKVMVRMQKAEETTPGGIVLQNPESNKAVVVGIGPDVLVKQKEFTDSHRLQEGDVVFLPRGTKVGEKFPTNDDLFLLLPFHAIAAKMNNEN